MFASMKLEKINIEFFKGLYKNAGEFYRNNEQIKKIRKSKNVGILSAFINEYWLLCFFILLVAYMELLYRVWIFRDLSFDYFFALIFAVSGGTAIYILVSLFPLKFVKKAAAAATLAITIVYSALLFH